MLFSYSAETVLKQDYALYITLIRSLKHKTVGLQLNLKGNARRIAPALLALLFLALFFQSVFAISNPAAVYCEEMNGVFKTISTPRGEKGICSLNEGALECGAWDFLEGKCGNEYSYCVRNGYGIETVADGENQFSKDYAVCVPPKIMSASSVDNSVGSVKEGVPQTKLMGLDEKLKSETAISDSLDIQQVSRKPAPNERELSKEIEIAETPITALPSSFDWRDVNSGNWMTPVKDQESCGSCWAFAAAGAAEAKVNIARGDPDFDPDLSEQYLVSCSSAGSCGGGYSLAAADYMSKVGTVDEDCFQYSASDESCSNKCATSERRLWAMDNYAYSIVGTENVKTALVEKGPLMASMCFGCGGYFDNGIYKCSDATTINHAVVIVGYGSDASGDYWIVKNSWDSTWGDNGYFKVGVGECYIDTYTKYFDYAPEVEATVLADSTPVYYANLVNFFEDTYTNNGVYFSLLETNPDMNCGLDVQFNFPVQDISNVSALDLYVKHRAMGGQTVLQFADANSLLWNSLGNTPALNWQMTKYNLCTGLAECENLAQNGARINYYDPADGVCSNNRVDIDWAFVEASGDGYCTADGSNGLRGYINSVQLNGAVKDSFSSNGYSDFTTPVFTELEKGGTFELRVGTYNYYDSLDYLKAWIDFNDDKVFSEDEKIDFGSRIIDGYYTFSTLFTVPEDINNADVRMRVYLKYSSAPAPCEKADYGEVEDYTISITEDVTPPYLYVPYYGEGYVAPASTANITAVVNDVTGVASVFADIKTYGEGSQGLVVVDTIQLYDDGNHNDGLAGDSIYGGEWVTPESETYYYVYFTATDNFGNTGDYNNYDQFTTKPWPEAQVLLVNPEGIYLDYYKMALDTTSYTYAQPNYWFWGLPDAEALMNYDVVVWPHPFGSPSSYGEQILSEYLDNGGNLFITGQDIGYYSRDHNFYSNYLGADYVQDDIGLHSLTGIDGTILEGVNIGISGGNGIGNQYWPDEIDPLSASQQLLIYDTNEVISADSFTPIPENLLRETAEKVEAKINAEVLEKNDEQPLSAVLSTGTGAVTVDNGLFRVVYFSFGFEAINTTEDRNYVMKKVLDWLAVDRSFPDITNEFPADGSFMLNSPAKITADMSDRSGVDTNTVVVTLDGKDIAEGATITDNNIEYALPEALEEGTHTVGIIAGDNEGNLMDSPHEWSFTIDQTGPEINLTPVNGSAYNSHKVIIEASDPAGIDANSLIYWIYYDNGLSAGHLIRDCNTDANTLRCEFDINFVDEKEYNTSAQVSDSLGNDANAESTFIYDITPPVCKILGPDFNGYYGTSSLPVTVFGTASDNNPGKVMPSLTWISSIAHYDFEISYDENAGTADWNSFWAPTSDGDLNLECTVFDEAGNESLASDSLSLKFDLTPPVPARLKERSPYAEGTSIDLNWEEDIGSDALSGLSHYELYRSVYRGAGYFGIVEIADALMDGAVEEEEEEQESGIIAVLDLNQTSYVDANLSDGNYTYTLYTHDLAGNYSDPPWPVSVVVDTEPPETSLYPSGCRSGDFNALLSATDAGAGVKAIYYSFEDGNWMEQPPTGIPITADGKYKIEYYAIDNLDKNEVVKTSYICRDSVSPVITSSGPSGTLSDSSVTLTANTDSASTCKYDTADLNYDDMEGDFSGEETTHTATLTLADGSYTYYAKCRDSAKNETTGTAIQFIISVPAPAPAPSAPAATSGGGGGGGGGGFATCTDPIKCKSIKCNRQVGLYKTGFLCQEDYTCGEAESTWWSPKSETEGVCCPLKCVKVSADTSAPAELENNTEADDSAELESSPEEPKKCEAGCNDSNPCTSDSCIEGECTHSTLADGVGCYKNGIKGVCGAGVCVFEQPVASLEGGQENGSDGNPMPNQMTGFFGLGETEGFLGLGGIGNVIYGTVIVVIVLGGLLFIKPFLIKP